MSETMFNILDYHINRDEFTTKYNVYKSSCKNYKDRELLSDSLRDVDGVLSTFNDRDGSTVCILAKKDPKYDRAVRTAFENSEIESANFTVLNINELDDRSALQLLLNSLQSMSSSTGNAISNAAGHFIWVRGVIGDAEDPDQLVSLKFEVKRTEDAPYDNNALILTWQITTYTNIRFKDGKELRITLNPKYPFETFAQYAYIDGRIVRAPQNWKGPRFIQRGLTRYGKKLRNTMNNLDIESINALIECKSYAASHVMNIFNDTFKEVAQISLKKYDLKRRSLSRLDKTREKTYYEILGNKVSLINTTKDSEKFNVLKQMVSDTGLEVVTPNSPGFENNVIYLVVDKTDENNPDDHYGIDNYNATQHIQLKNIPKKYNSRPNKPRPLIITSIKELAIKRDVKDSIIRTFDWTSLRFSEDVIFAAPVHPKDTINDDAPTDAAILTIHPDGTMDFRICNMINGPRWISEALSKDVEWVVQHGSNVMKSLSTKLMPVPCIDPIHAIIKDNIREGRGATFGLRNEKSRDELLQAVTDLNWLVVSEKEWYYYVGDIGYGTRGCFPHTPNVRKVTALGGVCFMHSLLDTMDVTFVRNRQSTVAPFPLKYLREYAKMKQYETY